mmetsp:Transcript_4475/g.8969  ORF Transcript_4475/g.8969 Transcript_4475/m.8969 type:complete len:548 (-) Transcript_4475:1658-3301(-)
MTKFRTLTKEEVQLSPSYYDGVSAEQEDRYRRETIRWISKTGESLRMPQPSIASASVYFHRFYSRYSFREYDRQLVACTCLFLAGKACESPKKLDDVVDHFNWLIYQRVKRLGKRPAKQSTEFLEYRNKVVKMECVLMEALEFEFVIIHPYPLLVQYLKQMFNLPEDQKKLHGAKGLAQVAWFFVNDSLRSTLCLTHEPEHVALGAINLALKHKKIDYDKLKKQETPWYRKFKITKEELDAVGAIILEAYSEPGRKPPDRKRDGKHHGFRLSKEEMERMKRMSPDEQASYMKRKKLESTMTAEERQTYIKMSSEERFAFRRKLERRQSAKRKLQNSSHRDRSMKHEPNVSSSSNAVSRASEKRTIPPERESDSAKEKRSELGKPVTKPTAQQAVAQPRKAALNGDKKEPDTRSLDSSSDEPKAEMHQKQIGTKRPHAIEKKQEQSEHVSKRPRTDAVRGHDTPPASPEPEPFVLPIYQKKKQSVAELSSSSKPAIRKKRKGLGDRTVAPRVKAKRTRAHSHSLQTRTEAVYPCPPGAPRGQTQGDFR